MCTSLAERFMGIRQYYASFGDILKGDYCFTPSSPMERRASAVTFMYSYSNPVWHYHCHVPSSRHLVHGKIYHSVDRTSSLSSLSPEPMNLSDLFLVRHQLWMP